MAVHRRPRLGQLARRCRDRTLPPIVRHGTAWMAGDARWGRCGSQPCGRWPGPEGPVRVVFGRVCGGSLACESDGPPFPTSWPVRGACAQAPRTRSARVRPPRDVMGVYRETRNIAQVQRGSWPRCSRGPCERRAACQQAFRHKARLQRILHKCKGRHEADVALASSDRWSTGRTTG